MGSEGQLLGSRVSALILRTTALLAEASDATTRSELDGAIMGLRNLREWLIQAPDPVFTEADRETPDDYVTRQVAVVDHIEATLRPPGGSSG